MAASWLLREKPFEWHKTTSQLESDSPTGYLNIHVNDALLCTGCNSCSARSKHRASFLATAFAAVSVVIFLAYLCSLFIRRRISSWSFGRKLAGGADAEESDEPESCISDTDSETVPSTHQAHRLRFIAGSKVTLPGEPWHAESETTVQTSPPLVSSAAIPSKHFVASRPQIGTAGGRMPSKRKEPQHDDDQGYAKMLRLEAPIQVTPPGPLPSYVHRKSDSLVNSAISGYRDALSEDSWAVDNALTEHVLSYSDDAGPSSAFPLQTGNGPRKKPGAEQSHPGLMPTSHVFSGLSGNPSDLGENESTYTTPLSFFESVLSESTHTPQSSSLDMWVLGDEAKALGEALSLVASHGTPSALPGSSEKAKAQAKGLGSLSGISAGGRVHSEILCHSEKSQNDSRREVIEEHPIAPRHGMGGRVLESTVLRSLLSSTLSTSAIPPSSDTEDEATMNEEKSSEQSVSGRAQSALEDLLASVGWLDEMLRGVPDHLLEAHPFYRHPGEHPSPSRTYNDKNAEPYRTGYPNIVPLLAECRLLLKKPWLALEDMEVLLDYTERLSGYASGVMPAHSRFLTTSFGVETMGRVFLVLDMLHCAAEVLGQSSEKDQWWPGIVLHIENARYRRRSRVPPRPCWSYPLLVAMDAALDFYRIGERPPLRLVIAIKLALFLSPMKTRFNKPKWDPWREDAKEWLQSIKASKQGGDQSTKQPTG